MLGKAKPFCKAQFASPHEREEPRPAEAEQGADVSLRTLDRALWQWSADKGTPVAPEEAM